MSFPPRPSRRRDRHAERDRIAGARDEALDRYLQDLVLTPEESRLAGDDRTAVAPQRPPPMREGRSRPGAAPNIDLLSVTSSSRDASVSPSHRPDRPTLQASAATAPHSSSSESASPRRIPAYRGPAARARLNRRPGDRSPMARPTYAEKWLRPDEEVAGRSSPASEDTVSDAAARHAPAASSDTRYRGPSAAEAQPDSDQWSRTRPERRSYATAQREVAEPRLGGCPTYATAPQRELAVLSGTLDRLNLLTARAQPASDRGSDVSDASWTAQSEPRNDQSWATARQRPVIPDSSWPRPTMNDQWLRSDAGDVSGTAWSEPDTDLSRPARQGPAPSDPWPRPSMNDQWLRSYLGNSDTARPEPREMPSYATAVQPTAASQRSRDSSSRADRTTAHDRAESTSSSSAAGSKSYKTWLD